MTQYSRWQDRQRSGAQTRTSQLDELRQRIHTFVIEQLGPLLTDQRVGEQETRKLVHEQLIRALGEEQIALSAAERQQLIQDVTDDVLGYGPIDRFLKDTTITEVMVNGPKSVYVERRGKIEQTEVEFVDEGHLRRIIDKIVAQVGRRIDEATPMVDARLPDGSRINAVIHPVAIGGPFLTIRKFSSVPYTVADLINFGTMSPQVAHFLDACVRGRLNVVVSGGTGSGKTTLLNVLSSFIPNDERIVTVEDAKELKLLQEHVCAMESRPPNIEGVGEIRIRDLVRNALRMRPDRIIVGEARGAEALDMLQAMNTGHDGSLTTIHSNSPRDTLARVETMTLMSGMELPMRAVREQMASALDMVVHLARLRDGTRRVTHVSEVLGMEGDTIVLQDLYLFDFGMGVDEDGRFLGHLKSTGIRPTFAERLADHGIVLEPELFTLEPFARRVVGLR
jgi:pilus assembly protein CpaF